MAAESNPWARRVLRGGGPPAVITAALGVGATGFAGQAVERETEPVADGAANALGVDPQFGPVLLVIAGVLVLFSAFVVPWLYEGGA